MIVTDLLVRDLLADDILGYQLWRKRGQRAARVADVSPSRRPALTVDLMSIALGIARHTGCACT